MKFKAPATLSLTIPNCWSSSPIFKLAALVLTLSLASCASSPKPTPKVTKTYSPETEKTFEEIEREQVLESYRQMRWNDWQQRQSERERQVERLEQRPRVIKPKPLPPVAPKKEVAVPRGNAEEIQVEIEQNMALFCMKMDGKGRFSDGNDCSAFTQNVLYECSDKYGEDDKRKVGCVKSALK